MHPRNPYVRPPDFLGLARQYPPLRPHVFLTHTGPSIDFKSQSAQRRLTEALLHLDFSISLILPEHRLCPPVPNRLNYVLWIQDIVKAHGPISEIVRGIDIGTGSSAIYPLLLCRLEPTWHFVVTDIDKDSLLSAQQNVERNGLSDRISVTEISPSEPILRPLQDDLSTVFHFTMCNPPFYSSAEEVALSTEAKEHGPNAVCTGSENEMITPGGEVSFVSRIFTESLRHRTRCRWFTSMLGKMSSIPEIVSVLHGHQVENYAITEFVQGQTRRWAVAWSFGTLRLPDAYARIANPALQSIMPQRTTLYQQLTSIQSLELLQNTVCRVLGDIEDLSIKLEKSSSDDRVPSVLAQAMDVTWTRSARRKKATKTSPQTSFQQSPALQCRITCKDGACPGGGKQSPTSVHIEYQWIDGSERSIFESFVSHVNRKVTAVQEGPR
ncbi:hypothetical protein HYDPIDRAFT_115472 [Hydnomerulius pinastri MD-312]|uniref:U6 small nuclear RNA (adenine-(43)-N(6))-methyltransferase n=1 Tax=Hydnomerulius pinastri MD-312 TaxID=994086 RepID=A0A0C9VUK4_9AGAM|nr:hypothetical protein HYDPIDRAFT_115472 [Hydnomerulius pinastri MD-312]